MSNRIAVMAQVAEHVLGKDEVTGSNPVNSSMQKVLERFCESVLRLFVYMLVINYIKG
jgi:hypothetical protein